MLESKQQQQKNEDCNSEVKNVQYFVVFSFTKIKEVDIEYYFRR